MSLIIFIESLIIGALVGIIYADWELIRAHRANRKASHKRIEVLEIELKYLKARLEAPPKHVSCRSVCSPIEGVLRPVEAILGPVGNKEDEVSHE